MKTIEKLGLEELLIYSAILAELSFLLRSDEKLRDSIKFSDSEFIEFPVQFTSDYIMIVTYNKKDNTFKYGDVLIPKGILDHLIEYS